MAELWHVTQLGPRYHAWGQMRRGLYGHPADDCREGCCCDFDRQFFGNVAAGEEPELFSVYDVESGKWALLE